MTAVLAGPSSTAELSRGEVESAVAGIVAALRQYGVRPSDRVTVLGDNSVEYVLVLLALVHLGTSIVLTDHRQTPSEIQRTTALARVQWMITDSDDTTVAGPRRLSFDEIVAGGTRLAPGAGRLSMAAWSAKADGLITWSSGSTGPSKGVVRSGGSFLDNIARTQQRMAYKTDDVLMPLLPFSHQYGLSLVLSWWQSGCRLLVAPYRRIDHAVELAARFGATVVDATPMTYRTVLNLLKQRPQLLPELRGVRMWCVGGSPLDRGLADRFHAVTGRPLLDGYGSTETGNIALATAADPAGCGLPLDGVRIMVRNEDGADAMPGEVGHILVDSPDVTHGYLAADGTVTPLAQGPYRTDDIGYQDAAGHLFVLGRRNAVHRMGYTLYPEALARKAAESGAPVEVVPVDDADRGCQLVFVVADPDGRDSGYWRARFQATMPAYELPNRVVVVPEFPVNNNGKPDSTRIRELVSARVEVQPSVPFPDRAEALHAVAQFIRANPDPVLEILCEVSPYQTASTELAGALATLAGALDEVAAHRPERVSRLAVFMSSNVLCYSYVLYLLVPLLYTERVVFRPSAKVAETTRRLHELLAPVHGLPIEISRLSQRKFVEGPAADADVLVFTGSYPNAEQIRSTLRPGQLMLFFGQGVNPFIVTPGADVDLAVEDAVRTRMLNCGQDCFGPDVFLVAASVAERFVELLAGRLGALRYGPYRDRDADYGPLFYDSALRVATEYLHTNRDHIVHGGRLDLRERHLEPTVLVRPCDVRIELDELFSPIFNVVVYADQDELGAFLRTPYLSDRAMAAMVYGPDPQTIEFLAKRHMMCVNRTLLDIDNGNAPFGGYGIVANYVAYGSTRIAEPLLVSHAVADHLRKAKEAAS
ncbi:acyl-coenzyme A synthetase/AMP-(fatty) acid ligase/acyl-CoA reductase-like NAD-dependent aldehyde dehydrogenase [Kibdelosporangium banguiense]|uniref:Acyl-coenzyme A synthetase/AMP-(Fatty) acid ligase/acyl-CoA reductase-like NAD-dependent aldehyde dehydrogenase n=1 Tax=Kibdelosporangium banguiense TaxID=1365924 RepID=A0ABS4U1Z2_9PSEU|nr:aldehyde dehydrogenase family protein [Kibdelosporangium banguiense]MBP2330651.1 acyl-coenzyme A synthetase/AMP-(fatty) acid ligase/acyl-CoA reductase-like NAD-dependent aldehyde dehydrogenase [Kibdelosporangium banguiense]